MVTTFKDISELSQYAAQAFIGIANKAIAEHGRFLVALSGGSTPMRLYELLGNQFQHDVDWSRAHFFWGDERCVPVDDAGNSYGQTKKVLFDKIGTTNIHRVNSDLAPDSAATDYADTLKVFSEPPNEWPRTAANGPNLSPALRTASTASAMFSRRPDDWPWPGRSIATTR